jgi:hypothetical protein
MKIIDLSFHTVWRSSAVNFFLTPKDLASTSIQLFFIAEIGMLVPVILTLAIAVITISVGGKIIGVFLVLLYPL